MLILEGVTRTFGQMSAVSDVSLQFRPGGFVGIIGRSGAGKSTLLRLINRLIDPTAGRVSFDGTDVTRLRGAELRAWRARAAMIFQQFNLVGRLDVLTNVLMGRLAAVPTWRALTAPVDRRGQGDRAVRARAVRCRGVRGAARRPAFRRPAAARRDRARAGAGAADHPGRRAGRLARSAQHRGGDGCAAADQQAFRHHGDLQPAFARSRAPLLRPAGRHRGRPRRLRWRAGAAHRCGGARALRPRSRRGDGPGARRQSTSRSPGHVRSGCGRPDQSVPTQKQKRREQCSTVAIS